MAEKELASTLREKMQKFGHIQRIESMTGIGVPDVNYCFSSIEGWIELKCLPAWPVRADTVVAIEHYTSQQRLWIRDRAKAGGRVYLLLEVIRPFPVTYLLFGPLAAVTNVGRVDRAKLERMAIVTGSGLFPTDKLRAELTSRVVRG